MKPLRDAERRYWQEYHDTLRPEDRPRDPFVEASFAGGPAITDELLELYLAGKKHAGSSVVEDFMSAGDPVPKVGNYWIYLDSKERPRLILRTERVETHKFLDVPESIAIAEGEGDLSLEYWRKVHARHYGPNLAKWGLSRIEEATIITEFFAIVYREAPGFQ